MAPLPPPGAGPGPVPGSPAGRRPPEAVRELLARHAAEPTAAGREELVEEFMPLARKLARRYLRTSEPQEDLNQVASMGLLKAIDRFDPARGVSFASFAIPTILGELRRYFRDSTWAVHVPRGAQERLQSIEAATARLTGQLGRSPTVEELSADLRLSQEEILDGLMVRRAYEADSIDLPAGREGDQEGGLAPADSLGVEEPGFDLVEQLATLGPAVRDLDERQRLVLHLRYVGEMSQSEIAAEIGVSQMQVSRILSATLARLRQQAAPAGED